MSELNKIFVAKENVRNEPYKLQAIDRAFAVLDALADSRDPMSLVQLTGTLGLHKSTVHRFLMVLERHRMVERTQEGTYRLGLRLHDLGTRALQQFDLWDYAKPHLRRLATEACETAHLCVLDKTQVVYLDKVEPNRSVCMTSRPGSSNPVQCTSVGKAMLAFLPEDKLELEVLPNIRYAHFTSKSIMNQEALLKELQRVRRRGYAVDDEEIETGVRCVGAPILDSRGYPIAAVSLSGPTFRITVQKVPAIAEMLRTCIQRISMDMGIRIRPGSVPPAMVAHRDRR
ncbi:MAG: IclR family transcriptional regulator [Acidobacteriaceae bacterium]